MLLLNGGIRENSKKTMIKRILLWAFFVFTINNISGQILVSFDSLIINDAIEVKSNDLLISHFSFGPYLSIFFSIENNTDSVLKIRNPYSDYHLPQYKYTKFVSIEYKINGKSIENEIVFGWSEDELIIHPHSKQNFEVGHSLSLPYNDYSNDYITILDHSQQLYERLPSLRLIVRIDEERIYSLIPQHVTEGDYFVDFIK